MSAKQPPNGKTVKTSKETKHKKKGKQAKKMRAEHKHEEKISTHLRGCSIK